MSSNSVSGTAETVGPGPLWEVPVDCANPRKIAVKDALGWFDGGAEALRGSWLLLAGGLLVSLLLHAWVLFLPGWGAVFAVVIAPVIYAGQLSVIHFSRTHKTRASWWRLLDGINHRCIALALLPLLQMLASAICILLFWLIDVSLGLDSLSALRMRQPGLAAYLFGGGLVSVLVVVNLSFFYFVPLVFLGNLSLKAALLGSFRACRSNLLPLLAYQIMTAILLCLGAVFFGVGMFYAVPLIVASNYFAFRQVLVADKSA